MSSHHITATYSRWADELDVTLGTHSAKWPHFAAWGTYTIGHLIGAAPDSSLARILTRAEERIFHDVMVERPTAVAHGLGCYDLARQRPEEADSLIFVGTLAIAQHEQRLIDRDLTEAFDTVPMDPVELTRLLFVRFPTETLYLAEDVPGHPGTAVSDWCKYPERIRWIIAVLDAHQHDPTLHQHPYPDESGYHAVLGAGLSMKGRKT